MPIKNLNYEGLSADVYVQKKMKDSKGNQGVSQILWEK